MRYLVVIGSLFLVAAAPALAAPVDTPPRITVEGTGHIYTMPDQALVLFTVRGEGATSDAAVTAMVSRRARIDAGLALFKQIDVTASQVSITEVRSRECQPSYGAPQLSTGPCAILGYVAELTVNVRTALPKQAGTIVSLVGREGGSGPRIVGFSLADPIDAQRRAVAAAFANARGKAEAIAEAGHVRIGALMSASSGGYNNVTQDLLARMRPPAPPPPALSVMMAPIPVELGPQPIETQATLVVTYEALP